MSTPDKSAADQIRTAMASTNELFSTEVFGKRNFGALADIYTSTARILPPGAPMISGLEGIKNFWSNLIESANAKSAVLETIDMVPSDDNPVEIGIAKLTVEPEGQSASQMEAKYVVCWQRENGRWKWHIDIWNLNS